MGKGVLKISDRGMVYIPDELRNDGFTGHVEYLTNGKVVTLMRPKTTLEEVKRSLEITIQDIEVRQGMAKRVKK